jgi:ABC-type uncharacterized transport system substrate-binding protein
VEAFRQGLQQSGYVEGKDILVEWRYADGKRDRLRELADELVRMKVDVIVTASTPSIRAVQQATKTVPIVMANVGDPVAQGFVASLARPGGNITGFTKPFSGREHKEARIAQGSFAKTSSSGRLFGTRTARPAMKQLEVSAPFSASPTTARRGARAR